MKLNKVLLSLAMTMSLATGMIGTTSVNAIDGYISDDDLSDTQTDAPKAWGVTPTNEQYRYQKEELAGFVHFGPNTFNEIEWGENYGDQTPDEMCIRDRNNGDTTSVKTGDNSLAGMFAGLALLGVAGYTVLRRKEN